MTHLPHLSSEMRRWLLAAVMLVIAGAGLTMLWGAGWGLLFIGLGAVLIVLLYDPDRAGRTP